jgi:hypothetical protein
MNVHFPLSRGGDLAMYELLSGKAIAASARWWRQLPHGSKSSTTTSSILK